MVKRNSPADRVIRLRKTFDTQHFISASSVHLREAVKTELLLLVRQGVVP